MTSELTSKYFDEIYEIEGFEDLFNKYCIQYNIEGEKDNLLFCNKIHFMRNLKKQNSETIYEFIKSIDKNASYDLINDIFYYQCTGQRYKRKKEGRIKMLMSRLFDGRGYIKKVKID